LQIARKKLEITVASEGRGNGIVFDLQLKAFDPLRRRINVSFRHPGQCQDLPFCLCDVKDKCMASKRGYVQRKPTFLFNTTGILVL